VPIHHLPYTIPNLPPRLSRIALSLDPLQRSKHLLKNVQRSANERETYHPELGAQSDITLPDRDIYTTDALRIEFFKVICKCLKIKGIDTSRLTEASLAWLLPAR
jgi:hypothetical protein